MSDSRARGPGFNTRSGHVFSFLLLLIQEGQLSVTGEGMCNKVLVNRLGGLCLPRKSVVRLTDCPNMALDVYRGRKTTIQQQPFILGIAEQLGVTLVSGLIRE